MLAKNIDGCDDCPISYDCTGMKCYGGMPIEPPCCSWNPNDEITAEDYENDKDIAADLYHQKQLEKEEEEKRKEIKAQRARESRWYVREETKKIKQLYKIINGKLRIKSFATALCVTNDIFRTKDDRPKTVKSIIDIEIEELKQQIESIKKIKKGKLRELLRKRKSQG